MSALLLALTIGLTPVLPCIDLPQHIALAALLRRVWDGDAQTNAIFSLNTATHNATIHLFCAFFARWVSVEVAARGFLALYPPLLLSGVTLFLHVRRLPIWRAILIVPAVLCFSFGWGFANFCIATALAWIALALVAWQLSESSPRWLLTALLAGISLLIGITHPFAMLLLALNAAALGVESLWRNKQHLSWLMSLRVLMAGAPLLTGCFYDLWVLSRHLSADASSYTTVGAHPGEASIAKKIYLFGSYCGGLLGTYSDTALCWCVVLLIGVLAYRAYRSPHRTVMGTEGPLTTTPEPAVAPFLVLLVLYFILPAVFLNTHLIFQRLAQWVLISALAAFPPLPREAHGGFKRIGIAISSITLVIVPLHFFWYTKEIQGLEAVLRAMPLNACSVGAIQTPRTASIRMATLTHVAVLAVARGGQNDGFSFARWMGMPLVYRKGQETPYPIPSWEHDGGLYQVKAPLARRFPWVVAHSGWAQEPEGLIRLRLFGNYSDNVRLIAHSEAWWLFDTTQVSTQSK